jgi:hypothetical protein
MLQAFDCVNHTVLLSKLQFYGTTENMYKLIRFYLGNGDQKCYSVENYLIHITVIEVPSRMVYHKVQYLIPYSLYCILKTYQK